MPKRNAIGAPNEPEAYCIIDPGTTNLRALAVAVASGEATVWGWASTHHHADSRQHQAVLGSEVADALAQAEASARSQAGEWFRADHMLVGLPASQLRGYAWPVTQRRAQPESLVQEQELRALLARALRLAVNRLRGPEEMDWLLVDAGLVGLNVDGRGVTDPVGFRAREIGATVVAVLAQAGLIDAWRQMAESHGFCTLTVAAIPMALTAGCSEAESLLLDVGGKTTDLIWTRSRLPVATNSLPIGGDAVTMALVRRWDLPLEKAEQLKRAYAAGEIADQARMQVSEAIAPALEAWLESTEITLAQLQEASDRTLPDRVYLLGGGCAIPDFLDAARSLAWSRKLGFARYPQFDRLRPQAIGGVVNRTDKGQGPGDAPALALAGWAAAMNRVPGRPARILNELCETQRT